MTDELKAPFTRRELLTACLIAGGTRLAGFNTLTQLEIPKADERDTLREGKRLGLVNFVGEPQVPVNVPFGTELDGRLVTDLSDLTVGKAVSPSERFYIRTRASRLLAAAARQQRHQHRRCPHSSRIGLSTDRAVR